MNKYQWKVCTFVILLIMSPMAFPLFSATASAHPARPAITCSPCTADGYFYPSQLNQTYFHGGFSDIYANDNGLVLQAGNYWVRELAFPTSSSNYTAFVGMGVNAYPCHSAQEQLFWLFSFNNGGAVYNCYPLSGSEYTDIWHLGVSYFVSNGGGTFFWLQDTSRTGHDKCAPCAYQVGSVGERFSSIVYLEQVLDTWSGVLVPRDWWKNNKVDDQNSNITYWTQGFSKLNAGNPPQMYWSPPPAGGNNGGSLVSCVIDQGGSC